MNIFSNLKKYAGKWSIKEVRPFSKEEKEAVHVATVAESQYGLSVCFLAKAGGKWYIPLEVNSSKQINDIINMDTAEVVTLSREGSDDIFRVRA